MFIPSESSSWYLTMKPSRSIEVNTDLIRRLEVEDFLVREAELLDQQKYTEWLSLLADDIVYWAPTVESIEDRRQTYNRVGGPSDMAFFQETKATLGMRVDRLAVGGAWAEIPPSRTCHFITNVMVESHSGAELTVRSKFFVFRSRLEVEEDTYYGSRLDVLRRTDGQMNFRLVPQESLQDREFSALTPLKMEITFRSGSIDRSYAPECTGTLAT